MTAWVCCFRCNTPSNELLGELYESTHSRLHNDRAVVSRCIEVYQSNPGVAHRYDKRYIELVFKKFMTAAIPEDTTL